MSARLALGCVLLVACGGAPASTLAPANKGGDDAAMMAAARAAERGKGGARDYAKAADLYAKLCAEGKGELSACVALADAMLAARGVAQDMQRLFALHAAMCERGDATACGANAMHEAMAVSRRDASADMAKALEQVFDAIAKACDAGDGRACEWRASMHGGDGGTAENNRRTWYGVACRAGRLDACGWLTMDLQLCEDLPGTDVAPCEARVLESWRDNKFDNDRLDAATRLRDACGAGDAVACKHVPGRALGLVELCKAHDYSACGQLGCVGDERAAEQARVHGVDRVNCRAAEAHALRDWLRTPEASRSTYAPIAAQPRGPIGARAAKPFEAVRFTLRGGRDAKGWPRFSIYNMHNRAVSELTLCLYAYGYDDAGAKQLQRVQVALPTISVAPDAIVPLEIDGLIPTALPETSDEVQVDYEHVRFAGDPTGTDDPTRCAAQRPHVPQPSTMTW